MLHRGHPQTVLTVYVHVHHHEVVIVGIGLAMIFQGAGVYPSETLLVGAYPDASLTILDKRHHHRGIAVKKVACLLTVGTDTIEAVLVGTHPQTSLAIHKHAHHEGGAQQVLRSLLVTHVTEPAGRNGLFVHALLHQSYPQVARVVLNKRVHFAFGQVHLRTIEGIVGETLSRRVVDGHALAVVAHHNPTLAVAVERRDGMAAGGCHLLKVCTCQTIDTVVGRAHIDAVLTIAAHHTQVVATGKIVLHILSVKTIPSLSVTSHRR